MDVPDLNTLDPTMSAAAAAGSVAQTFLNRSKDTTRRKIAEGISGMLVGVFFGPAVGDLVDVHKENLRLAIAFATGAAGIALLTLVVDVVKSQKFREWLLSKKPQ